MQGPIGAPVAPSFARRWTPRRVMLATLAVVGVVAAFYLLYRFFNVLFVVFVAAVLATAMRPAVQWLEKRHVPPRAGVLLIYLTLLLITSGVLAALIPLLIEQGSQIVDQVPGYYTGLREELSSSRSLILRRIGNNLPQQLEFGALPAPQSQDAGSGEQPSVAAQVTGYVRSFGWGIFSFLAVFLIAYFWTLDRDHIVRSGLLLAPIDRRPEAQSLWERMEEKVGAYVRGQALLMLSIGICTAVALFALRLPSALVIAVIAGILEAVPYIGPILTALIAVLITLASAPEQVWWVLGAMLLIQQIENVILVPRIMDRAVGVNPLVTLLAIAAFGSLLGVVGAILAIPLAAIIQVLLEHWLLSREAQPAVEIEGRDKAAVVRYLAQDLAQDIRERIRARPSDQDQEDDSIEEQIETVVGDIDALLVQVSTPASPQAVSTPGGR